MLIWKNSTAFSTNVWELYSGIQIDPGTRVVIGFVPTTGEFTASVNVTYPAVAPAISYLASGDGCVTASVGAATALPVDVAVRCLGRDEHLFIEDYESNGQDMNYLDFGIATLSDGASLSTTSSWVPSVQQPFNVTNIPAGTQKADAAEKFVSWATSKHYAELVAAKEGWANVPPGTRSSLYANADYQKAAPFAKMTLDSINAADPTHPTVKPVPYVGVQFVAIPEFQGLGTTVGQLFSAALAGQSSVDDALKQAQDAATAAMTEGGYIK